MRLGELLCDAQALILDCAALLCTGTGSITPYIVTTYSQVGPHTRIQRTPVMQRCTRAMHLCGSRPARARPAPAFLPSPISDPLHSSVHWCRSEVPRALCSASVRPNG